MDNIELLFFDTFSHDISEELNLDLVQFPKPVYISEVRIIPLGARVQADFPGGVRLGATNPSQFAIEFFVNDLSKPGASTFEFLGSLDYKQNIHIQLECDRKQIPTDGLVLRGWYTTITLAVYGTLTKSLNHPQEVIGSTAGTTACVNILEENSEGSAQVSSEQQSEWYYQNQHQINSSETCVTTTPPPPVQPIQVIEPSRSSASDSGKTESRQWEEEIPNIDEKSPKRPLSPPTESLISLSPESISAEEEEAEQQEVGEMETGEPFEPILSDEDIMTDDIPSAAEFECEALQIDEIYTLIPPNLLNLEKMGNLEDAYVNHETLSKIREILQSLSKSVSHFYNTSGQEKETFVHNCETLCAILGPFDANADDINDLTNIVNAGLDMELARAQPQPVYKVRHVKVGVRLAEVLCRLSKGPEILLKVEAPSKLLSLCMRENVALPVKLSALRALDAALISPMIVQEFLSSRNNLYRNALTMLDTVKLARLKYALSSLLRKVHIYEYLEETKKFDEFGLAELTSAYVCAPTLMAQPKRQLPAGAQMEFEREYTRNPRAHLVAYFEHQKLIHHLLLELSSPNSDLKVIKLIRRFLLHLSATKEGLFHLLKEAEVVRLMLRALKYDLPGAGCILGWRLQVAQCLIRLKQSSDWTILKRLHSFLIFPDGLRAILTVLPLDDFMDILIPYLSNSNLCEFAAELISAIVRYSDKVEIFQNRAELILDKAREHAVLRDVTLYLTTAAQASHWDYNDLSLLVTTIRKSAEKAASLPGQLITACRILHYLIFPSNNDVDPLEPYIELKYRNALTQLFAADGLTALVSVMANVSEFYEQPFLHRAALTGRRGMALVALLLPCVKLIRALLESLVKCMATDFKDLTAVVPLLRIYSLIEAIPTNSMTQNLSEEIVGTLLVFTQAVDSDGSGNVAKSLWTQMLGEVLKTVSLCPCNFVPGLKLLTRLLPPVLTPKEIAIEDATRILSLRKLWSAHLQAQATNLTETLRLLCASWDGDVSLLLSTVCKQLSDLAAPTALLVGRCLLDGILVATPLENNLPILALISDLARHAPMKATLLTLTSPASRAQVKSDQKYPPVIEMMCSTLKSSNDIQVQKEILSIFETLCDCKLSLVQEDNEPFEKRLTHSVPSKEPLLSILTALIEILATSTKFKSNIIESTLHVLLPLSSHNYGMYHVKSCLENNPGALRSLLDYATTLDEPETNPIANLTVTFLENLIASDSEGRTLHLRAQQLASLISWEKNDHPLEKLKRAEELVETLKAAEEREEKEPIPEMLEPLLPTPEALLNQFAQRYPGAISNSAARPRKFSFTTIHQTQIENTVDLLALATELLPADFNLLAESQNLCSKTPPDDATQLLQSKSQSEDEGNRTEKQISPMAKSKQLFVTPARGRTQFTNSLRGGPVGGGVGRGADPFRSRPPNTSRPPSLHVDEFVALETCGAQPTGPTGYNKLNIRGTCPSRVISGGARSRPWTQETRPPYLR